MTIGERLCFNDVDDGQSCPTNVRPHLAPLVEKYIYIYTSYSRGTSSLGSDLTEGRDWQLRIRQAHATQLHLSSCPSQVTASTSSSRGKGVSWLRMASHRLMFAEVCHNGKTKFPAATKKGSIPGTRTNKRQQWEQQQQHQHCLRHQPTNQQRTNYSSQLT